MLKKVMLMILVIFFLAPHQIEAKGGRGGGGKSKGGHGGKSSGGGRGYGINFDHQHFLHILNFFYSCMQFFKSTMALKNCPIL